MPDNSDLERFIQKHHEIGGISQVIVEKHPDIPVQD